MTQTILLVDDNKTDRYILKRRLEKISDDLVVLEAENGEHAIEAFSDYEAEREKGPSTKPPLIVFLDINMPIMDGFGLLEALHSMGSASDSGVPTVFMFTSSHRDEDKERSMHWDFVKEYIVKGDLSAEKLKSILADHLKAQPV
ncbi:MAG: response regulator [Pseudomonadota bacterium]